MLSAFEVLDRGDLVRIEGEAVTVGKLPLKMAEEMAVAAEKHIKWYLSSIGKKKTNKSGTSSKEGGGGGGVGGGKDGKTNSSNKSAVDIKITASHEDHPRSSASFIILRAHTSKGCILAASALGERGKKASAVGHSCAQMLVAEWKAGGCVDSHLQDQLIIFMALANGQSKLRCGPLTLHTRTAIYLAEKLTGANFTVTPISDDGRKVTSVALRSVTLRSVTLRSVPLRYVTLRKLSLFLFSNNMMNHRSD